MSSAFIMASLSAHPQGSSKNSYGEVAEMSVQLLGGDRVRIGHAALAMAKYCI